MGRMTRTLAYVAQAVGGQLQGPDRPFEGVSIDSRKSPAGALFIALKGPNFDGHAFAADAVKQGAVALLVDHPVEAGVPQVVVPDTFAALTRLASEWRRRFSLPVVGVTGSNGKTTTKEILGTILAREGSCLVTRGNLNNHLGVPLMLLELESSHRSAVIEMGANHGGEIAHLAALAQPTVGLVTNAGAAHLEGFGSLEGVARGKGEMFSALAGRGTAIINADDVYAPLWKSLAGASRVLTFGIESAADVVARDVRLEAGPAGFRSVFDLVMPAGVRTVTLQLGGLHNVRNALGAAAAASAAGASFDHIVAGLSQVRPVAGRLDLRRARGGAFIVDDSYNANPTSLRAGLDTFRGLPGRRWLVLGEMREVGAEADERHAEIGRFARDTGIERLFAVGEGTRPAVAAFGSGAEWFADLDKLIAAIEPGLEPGITILVKGSRSNRLERVAAALDVDPVQAAAGGH
jgi:UDP-N-acetylmuramoyl-tripeptide--D-alanyl-D-alanine ligase